MDINKQLNIPMITAKSAYRVSQLQGKHTPYTGSSDWDMDTYNLEDIQDPNWYNQVVNSKGSEWSNFYPICTKSDCSECKAECKTKHSSWRKGGKECYWNCRNNRNIAENTVLPTPAEVVATNGTSTPSGQKGLSQPVKIGLIVGGLAVVGIIGFVVLKKKGKI